MRLLRDFSGRANGHDVGVASQNAGGGGGGNEGGNELTGQIVHGLPDLPVIDIVAVEEVHVSLVELLVGLLGAVVGRSGALRADDGGRRPRHHRAARRRGHACRYDAQHILFSSKSSHEKRPCGPIIRLLRKPVGSRSCALIRGTSDQAARPTSDREPARAFESDPRKSRYSRNYELEVDRSDNL